LPNLVRCLLSLLAEASKTLNKGQESVPLFPWNEEWEKVAK